MEPRELFPGEEPSAELREVASAVRQMYVALVHEGFAEHEALVIVGQVLTASIQKPKDT